MTLPASIDSATPAGSDSPATIDNQIRALKLAIEDILGIPDATNVTQAAFDMDAGGLAQAIFYDAAVLPASGELGRNGSPLYYRVTDSRTATVLRALGIVADTSGTPAAGIGTGILVQAESGDESPSDLIAIDGVFSDVAAGSEDSYLSVSLRVGGRALDEKYRFTSTAGDGFTAIFAHAATADRTYTLPDADTTLTGPESGVWASAVRAIDTVYQNTGGKKRRVIGIVVFSASAASEASLAVGSTSTPTILLTPFGPSAALAGAGDLRIPIMFEVPSNYYWRIATVTGTVSLDDFHEMDE